MHSLHCYFLLAGSSETPILYHVERVRDGRSYATRTVQARQKGACIFTTTISFVRQVNPEKKQREVSHAATLPENVTAPADDWDGEPEWARTGPFQSHRIEVLGSNDPNVKPQDRKSRQWMRSRQKISAAGGHQAHLNALAYMSDSYFIGTVSRLHGLWRFPFSPEEVPSLDQKTQEKVKEMCEFEGMGSDVEDWKKRDHVGMMVSLDHSIYFHEPTAVKADEWMFTETESPWAGDGRGVVTQKIFGKDGALLATCFQEVSLLFPFLCVLRILTLCRALFGLSRMVERRLQSCSLLFSPREFCSFRLFTDTIIFISTIQSILARSLFCC